MSAVMYFLAASMQRGRKLASKNMGSIVPRLGVERCRREDRGTQTGEMQGVGRNVPSR